MSIYNKCLWSTELNYFLNSIPSMISYLHDCLLFGVGNHILSSLVEKGDEAKRETEPKSLRELRPDHPLKYRVESLLSSCEQPRWPPFRIFDHVDSLQKRLLLFIYFIFVSISLHSLGLINVGGWNQAMRALFYSSYQSYLCQGLVV